MSVSYRIDIDAYLQRIGYTGPVRPDLDTLRALHSLHPAAIAFENLDSLARRTVCLDPPELERKLVQRRRGGYCFEQNLLFGAVLEQLGFEVNGLAARVLWNRADDRPRPRTHMLLELRIGGERHIADVGFGGLTLTGPLLLEPDLDQATPHETFRLMREGTEYAVQVRLGSEYKPLYSFDLQPQHAVDFEVLNHYVSTHPDSPFLTTLMAARRTAEGRYALRNNALQIYSTEASVERRVLSSVAEIRKTLEDLFLIDVPEDEAVDAGLRACIE